MQSLSSFMSLGLNQLLTRWSDTAGLLCWGLFKIQSFVFMPIFGVNSGLIPILSYNYGAKSAPRLSQAVRFGVQLALSAAAAGAVLLALPPAPCCGTASMPVERPPPWGCPLCAWRPLLPHRPR